MNLKQLKQDWNKLGKIDPLWAILSRPIKKNNKWDLKEFFITGEDEIKKIMDYINSLDIHFTYNKALDFGSGVGRITQALSSYFNQCYGVDIAPSMIKLAKKYNVHGKKCRYILNKSNNLSVFSKNYFDFIYSRIVLQHMEPQYSLLYLKEFLRILKKNSLLIFQLPGELKFQEQTITKNKNKLNKENPESLIKMYGIKNNEVIKFIKVNNGKIIDIIKDDSAGREWESFQYCITK